MLQGSGESRVGVIIYSTCAQCELLQFSHARQSRGKGYSFPSVHFAREAIDEDPATYSCTQSTKNSWIQLYFDTPSLPEWILFSLKSTSKTPLSNHTVDLYNGDKKMRSCKLEWNTKWNCTKPVTLVTSVRVSVERGKMEIASIEAHGQRLPIEGINNMLCVMKNYTHLEVTYGTEVHFLKELPLDPYQTNPSQNGCESPFAGDTVGFVNFEDLDNLGKTQFIFTQYRAAVAEMSGPERFSNNDWMKASQRMKYPLKLERSGLIIHLDPGQVDERDIDSFTVQLFADWGVDMETEPTRLGAITLSRMFLTLEGCFENTGKSNANLYYVSRPRMMLGTWIFEKNETHLVVCKEDTVLLTYEFAEGGVQCNYTYSGNVVDGFNAETSSLSYLQYREINKSGPDEMRYIRSCPYCAPDYFDLHEQGLEWRTETEVEFRAVPGTLNVTIKMLDKYMGIIGTLALSPNSIAFKGNDQVCNWIESGNFDMTGDWRLFKNETLLCLFVNREVVVEIRSRQPYGVCGSAAAVSVRYVNFGQEDILYRRHKKDIEREIERVQEDAGRCKTGYRAQAIYTTMEWTGEVKCEPCRRGTYGNGRECLSCPYGSTTMYMTSTSPDQCMPAGMIECDRDGMNCWYKSDSGYMNNSTDYCNCMPDQYCDQGWCYNHEYDYAMSGGTTRSTLPVTIFYVVFLAVTATLPF
ncbi:uncharacterized protein LOC134821980 [Bolinopsis microptera]|uniref:uncharacterized protein LOC134821980 n=1 Tax=Bolinopsis microptera TaxID=2820187 RepID=UPI0030791862